jgi:hypothetical protein
MVRTCEKCDEYAYASRYKDSFLSFCRACGYYHDVNVGEGFYSEEKLSEMREKWPLRGMGDK